MKAGETIVVHAAAGGVGLILCQWAKHLGATVIGVVSTEEKAALARAHGAAHTVIGYSNLVAEVKRVTGGAMVPVVYDSIGKDTFTTSLDCLAPLGLMVSYGNASGPVPPVDIGILAAKGSLFLTRPTLATYAAKRADLEKTANDLFDVVQKGAVKIAVNQTFPLKDAAAGAHRAGIPQDHRQHRPAALSSTRSSLSAPGGGEGRVRWGTLRRLEPGPDEHARSHPFRRQEHAGRSAPDFRRDRPGHARAGYRLR